MDSHGDMPRDGPYTVDEQCGIRRYTTSFDNIKVCLAGLVINALASL